MKSCSVTIQMKAVEQCFLIMVLFIILYKVVLTFDSMDKSTATIPLRKH